MSLYNMNSLLRNTRILKKITQEEVADGICSITALSKYENGSLMPSLTKFYALMERMGECPNNFMIFINDKNYNLIKECINIENQIRYKRYNTAYCELSYLQRISKTADVLLNQFIVSERVIIDFYLNGAGVKTENGLFEALRLTLPKFNIFTDDRLFYTHQEFNILYNLALYYYQVDKFEDSVVILYKLKNSIDNIECINNSDEYLLILYLLTKCTYKLEQFDSSMAFCNNALEQSNKYSNWALLSKIFKYKAQILFKIGDFTIGREFMEKSIQLNNIIYSV